MPSSRSAARKMSPNPSANVRNAYDTMIWLLKVSFRTTMAESACGDFPSRAWLVTQAAGLIRIPH